MTRRGRDGTEMPDEFDEPPAPTLPGMPETKVPPSQCTRCEHAVICAYRVNRDDEHVWLGNDREHAMATLEEMGLHPINDLYEAVYPCPNCRPDAFELWVHGGSNPEHRRNGCAKCHELGVS